MRNFLFKQWMKSLSPVIAVATVAACSTNDESIHVNDPVP